MHKIMELNSDEIIKQYIMDNIKLLFYVDQYEVKNNHDIFPILNSYIKKIGIEDLTLNGRRFLSVYNSYIKKEKIETINDFGHTNNRLNFMNLSSAFCQKYYKEGVTKFFKILGRSERLRKILIDIINGEISLHGVDVDLKEEYENFLKNQNINAKTFLIIGNKIGRAKDAFVNEIPFIHSGVRAYNFTKNNLRMTLFIIKSERINTEEDVYELFREHLKDKYYLCVIPVDFNRSKNYVSHDVGNFGTPFMNECSIALNYLKTGNIEEDIDVWAFFTQQNIEVGSLLSSIPFTVYVDDLTEPEQELLISNYESIKNHFNISQLHQWKNITIKKLASYIYELFTEDSSITKKRAKEIARQIKNTAIDYSESLKPLVWT